MWEVYSEGRLPYESRSNVEVVESLNAGLRLLKPRQTPNAVHQLMEWCWKEVGDPVSPSVPKHAIQRDDVFTFRRIFCLIFLIYLI